MVRFKEVVKSFIIGEAELVAAFLAFVHLLGELDKFRDYMTRTKWLIPFLF